MNCPKLQAKPFSNKFDIFGSPARQLATLSPIVLPLFPALNPLLRCWSACLTARSQSAVTARRRRDSAKTRKSIPDYPTTPLLTRPLYLSVEP